MAPKTIYYPPTGTMGKTSTEHDCLAYGDQLTIVFTQSGNLSYNEAPSGSFNPALPMGNFLVNNVIGPYVADSHNHTVNVTFAYGGNTETDVIKIKASCP